MSKTKHISQGDTVTLNLSATDADGHAVLYYEVLWGDSSDVVSGTERYFPSQSPVTHVYADPGLHSVRVTAYNDHGVPGFETLTVFCAPTNTTTPLLSFKTTSELPIHQPGVFDAVIYFRETEIYRFDIHDVASHGWRSHLVNVTAALDADGKVGVDAASLAGRADFKFAIERVGTVDSDNPEPGNNSNNDSKNDAAFYVADIWLWNDPALRATNGFWDKCDPRFTQARSRNGDYDPEYDYGLTGGGGRVNQQDTPSDWGGVAAMSGTDITSNKQKQTKAYAALLKPRGVTISRANANQDLVATWNGAHADLTGVTAEVTYRYLSNDTIAFGPVEVTGGVTTHTWASGSAATAACRAEVRFKSTTGTHDHTPGAVVYSRKGEASEPGEAVQPASVRTSSLVDYWAFNEASGVFADAHGTGNNLAVGLGTPLYRQQGRPEYGWKSATNTVRLDGVPSITADSNYTIGLWYRSEPTANYSTDVTLVDLGGATSGVLIANHGTDQITWQANGVSAVIGNLSDETWYFIQLRHSATDNTYQLRANRRAWTTSSAYAGAATAFGANLHIRAAGTMSGLGMWQESLSDTNLDYIYNLGKGRTYANLGDVDLSLTAGTVSWPQPTVANVGADPHTGATWAQQGTVSVTSGALRGRDAWTLNGTNHMKAPLDGSSNPTIVGRPQTILNGDWAIAVAVRRGGAGWHAIWGTGGTSNSDKGVNLHFHGTTGQWRVGTSNGATTDNEYIGNKKPPTDGSKWGVAVLNYNNVTGEARTFVDGEWYETTDRDHLSTLQDATVTPSNHFAWGTRIFGTNSYGYLGDIVPLGVYSRQLTHDEAIGITNRVQGVTYSEVQQWDNHTKIRWALAGLPSGRVARASVYAPHSTNVRLKAYVRGTNTEAAQGTDVAPDADGIAQPTITLPADHTAYDLVVIADTYEQFAWPMRVVTQPTGAANFRAVHLGCLYTPYFTAAAHYIQNLAEGTKGLDMVTWNGDFHYEDPTNKDGVIKALEVALAGHDGQHSRRQIVRQAGLVNLIDNHELNVAAAASPDKDTPGTAEMVAVYRKALPGRDYGDANALYRSHVWGRTRWIFMDCRSERDNDAAPNPIMMSDTQLTWVKNEITAARTNNQVVVLVSSSPWEGVQSDTWGTLAPAQRTSICDQVQTEYLASGADADSRWFHAILLLGDYHSVRADVFKTGKTTASITAGATSIQVDTEPGLKVGSDSTTAKMTLDLGGANQETVTVNSRTANADGTFTLGLTSGTVNSHVSGVRFRLTRYGSYCTTGTAPISGFHSGRLSHNYGGLDDGLATDVRQTGSDTYALVDVEDDGTSRTTHVSVRTSGAAIFQWARSNPGAKQAKVVQFGDGNRQGNLNDILTVKNVSATLPATATFGNRLIASVTIDKDSGVIDVPSGWQQLYVMNDSNVSHAVFTKVSNGTETSVTISWQGGASTGSAMCSIVEVSGTTKPLPLATSASTGDTNSTTLSVALGSNTPTTGLALVYGGQDSAGSGTSRTAFPYTASDGYTSILQIPRDGGVTANGVATHVVFEKRLTSGENGATTLTSNNSDQFKGGIVFLPDAAV